MSQDLSARFTELVESIRPYIRRIAETKKSTILFLAALSGFFTFPFTICSLVVSQTSNAGFNVVLTSILNISFFFISVYIISKSKTPIAVSLMTIFNLIK
jgi:hypothetical protein